MYMYPDAPMIGSIIGISLLILLNIGISYSFVCFEIIDT